MASAFSFYDRKHRITSLREAVEDGFTKNPKSIPPKFFYDERGSLLFDRICEQPEYYVPDAEREILRDRSHEIAELVGPDSVVVEPGAGNSDKVRLLLNALRPKAYVPMDISGLYLIAAAKRLAEEYPWLHVHACCTDFSRDMRLPEGVPDAPRMAFFPGSSLGNFDPPDAAAFLRKIAHLVGTGGRLLIGIDRKKDRHILDAAYNDKEGLTAEFNLNLLTRMNRELGANFNHDQFRHYSVYESERGRIEMYLISLCEQEVRVGGDVFRLGLGERIHTENSYKYTPQEFQDLAREAGFSPLRHWTDGAGLFSVHLLEVACTMPRCSANESLAFVSF